MPSKDDLSQKARHADSDEHLENMQVRAFMNKLSKEAIAFMKQLAFECPNREVGQFIYNLIIDHMRQPYVEVSSQIECNTKQLQLGNGGESCPAVIVRTTLPAAPFTSAVQQFIPTSSIGSTESYRLAIKQEPTEDLTAASHVPLASPPADHPQVKPSGRIKSEPIESLHSPCVDLHVSSALSTVAVADEPLTIPSLKISSKIEQPQRAVVPIPLAAIRPVVSTIAKQPSCSGIAPDSRDGFKPSIVQVVAQTLQQPAKFDTKPKQAAAARAVKVPDTDAKAEATKVSSEKKTSAKSSPLDDSKQLSMPPTVASRPPTTAKAAAKADIQGVATLSVQQRGVHPTAKEMSVTNRIVQQTVAASIEQPDGATTIHQTNATLKQPAPATLSDVLAVAMASQHQDAESKYKRKSPLKAQPVTPAKIKPKSAQTPQKPAAAKPVTRSVTAEFERLLDEAAQLQEAVQVTARRVSVARAPQQATAAVSVQRPVFEQKSACLVASSIHKPPVEAEVQRVTYEPDLQRQRIQPIDPIQRRPEGDRTEVSIVSRFLKALNKQIERINKIRGIGIKTGIASELLHLQVDRVDDPRPLFDEIFFRSSAEYAKVSARKTVADLDRFNHPSVSKLQGQLIGVVNVIESIEKRVEQAIANHRWNKKSGGPRVKATKAAGRPTNAPSNLAGHMHITAKRPPQVTWRNPLSNPPEKKRRMIGLPNQSNVMQHRSLHNNHVPLRSNSPPPSFDSAHTRDYIERNVQRITMPNLSNVVQHGFMQNTHVRRNSPLVRFEPAYPHDSREGNELSCDEDDYTEAEFSPLSSPRYDD